MHATHRHTLSHNYRQLELWQDCPIAPFDTLKSDEAISRLSVCRPHSALEQANCHGGIGRTSVCSKMNNSPSLICVRDFDPAYRRLKIFFGNILVTHTLLGTLIIGEGRLCNSPPQWGSSSARGMAISWALRLRRQERSTSGGG